MGNLIRPINAIETTYLVVKQFFAWHLLSGAAI